MAIEALVNTFVPSLVILTLNIDGSLNIIFHVPNILNTASLLS
jgi:hypothetical protein